MMISAGILSILATWAVVALALVGWGFAARRSFGLRRLCTDAALMSFWMGFALVILFLQLWHLWLPVSWEAAVVVGAVGLAGLVGYAREVREWTSRINWHQRWPDLLALGSAAVWTADRAMGPLKVYDSGNYHMPVVLWSKTYHIIPGLGNLHDRLAFNNSHLLYAAMLDHGPWSGRSQHLADGLLLLGLLARVMLSGFRLARGGPGRNDRHLFDLLLLAPSIGLVRSTVVSSLSTDAAVIAVLLVAGADLYGYISESADSGDLGEKAHLVVAITSLLVLAACIKLSAIAFAAVGWALAVTIWIQEYRRRGPLFRRALGWVASIAVWLGGGWVVRGVLLSGYPAFPSTSLAFPVKWRLPEELARVEAALITHYARTGQPAGLGDPWFSHWLRSLAGVPSARWQIAIPALLALLGGAICAWEVRRLLDAPRILRRGWALLAPIFAGLALWGFKAPAPRFGLPFFWLLAALVVTQIFNIVGPESLEKVRPWLLGCLLLAIIPLTPIGTTYFHDREAGDELGGLFVSSSTNSLWAPLPQVGLSQYLTNYGLTLNIPLRDTRCFWATLPCTPYPAPNLRLIEPGHMESGFMTVGAWKQQYWPRRQSDFVDRWYRLEQRQPSSE